MAETSGEKNLKPTAKRLREARQRGQVVRSRDLASAVGLLAATGVLAVSGGTLLGRLQGLVVGALSQLDAVAKRPPEEQLSALVLSGGSLLALACGPVALAAGAAGVATAFVQGGITLSATPLQPSWARLSPMNGLRRLAPARSGVDTIKALLTASVLVALAWRVGNELALDAPRLVGAAPASSSARAWALVMRLLWQAGGALLALGVADYAIQKWRLTSSLKMTRHEVQEEAKSEDGRPETKARVRRIQRDMARRRMLKATARATVVVTNPTHYAVALEYSRDKAPAPIVVAKGRDLIAARIREIARTNGVPIVENPSLARALYAGAEVGDTIPAPLFGAVAEVLAYLVRIRQLML